LPFKCDLQRYIAVVRGRSGSHGGDCDDGDDGKQRVSTTTGGGGGDVVRSLGPAEFRPGDVMVLRGRRVLHRVTPVRYRDADDAATRAGYAMGKQSEEEEENKVDVEGEGEGDRGDRDDGGGGGEGEVEGEEKKKQHHPRVLAVLSFETEPGGAVHVESS
jgi:hypothetical protein